MLNRQVERPHNTTFSRKRCFFLDLLRRRDLFHLIILLFSFVEYHDIGKQQESQKNIDPRKMSTSGKILCRLRPEYLNHESIKLDPKIVNDVDTMLMFIGYPRSGHTLIGSLLDAHPNMVVANEYNILGNWENYTTKHRNKQYLFEQLYTNSFLEAREGDRSSADCFPKTKYNYLVPNQWQGKFDGKIKVSAQYRFSSITDIRVTTSQTTRVSLMIIIIIERNDNAQSFGGRKVKPSPQSFTRSVGHFQSPDTP